jgi:hypothetical protein
MRIFSKIFNVIYENSKITIMVALIIKIFSPMAQDTLLGGDLLFIEATTSHSVRETTLGRAPLN